MRPLKNGRANRREDEMKTLCIRAIGVSLLVMLFAGAASGETIQVGVIATFSGPNAIWGKQFQEVIQVYVAQHGSEVNGNKVEFVYKDVGGPNPDASKGCGTRVAGSRRCKIFGRLRLHAKCHGSGAAHHAGESARCHLQFGDIRNQQAVAIFCTDQLHSLAGDGAGREMGRQKRLEESYHRSL